MAGGRGPGPGGPMRGAFLTSEELDPRPGGDRYRSAVHASDQECGEGQMVPDK